MESLQKSAKIRVGILSVGGLLILSLFQNCSAVEFSEVRQEVKKLNDNSPGFIDEVPSIVSCDNEYVGNGSFEYLSKKLGITFETELSDLSGWDVFDHLPSRSPESDYSWFTESGSGIEVQHSGVVTSSQNGNLHVELDSHQSKLGGNTNTTMSQNLKLPVGNFSLVFYYFGRSSKASSNKIEVLLAGEVISTHATSLHKWQQISIPISINVPGQFKLSFRAGGEEDSYGALLDNISLKAVCESHASNGL